MGSTSQAERLLESVSILPSSAGSADCETMLQSPMREHNAIVFYSRRSAFKNILGVLFYSIQIPLKKGTEEVVRTC